MNVRLRAFARIRELLETGEEILVVEDGATVEDVWCMLTQRAFALGPLRQSTRFARNGALVAPDAQLNEGDELALLPPSSGG